jgi:LmbE family N-acetylglucosaminyl deacetylase
MRLMHSSVARRRAAVIVAHPDDETLWCGGFILEHPAWSWDVVALSRARDPDRAPRFRRVLARLGATGVLGDLDDGPEQRPLPSAEVEEAVASLLPRRAFDLVLTHGPRGEYTRHRRHEECCRAVVALWQSGRLETRELWFFAYQDGGQAHLPRVSGGADRRRRLPERVWRVKLEIVKGLYGFGRESWEARATPREEGFWCFSSPAGAVDRITSRGFPA